MVSGYNGGGLGFAHHLRNTGGQTGTTRTSLWFNIQEEGVKTERMLEHTEIKIEIRNRKDWDGGDKKYDQGWDKDEEIGR